MPNSYFKYGNRTVAMCATLGLLAVLVGCQRTSAVPRTQSTPTTSADAAAAPKASAATADAPASADTTGQTVAAHDRPVDELIAERNQLDDTVWSSEVQAQRHEDVFVQLWDRMRSVTGDAWETLASASFQELSFGQVAPAIDHVLSIREFPLSGDRQIVAASSWRTWLGEFKAAGYEIDQSEWHHARFVPATTQSSPESWVNFVIDLSRSSPARRVSLRGTLHIHWLPSDASSVPQPGRVELEQGTLWVRDDTPVFREILQLHTDSRHPRLMPVLVEDLDGNGGSEIVLGGLDRIEWNDGQGHFKSEAITNPRVDMFDAAVLANFAGDEHLDLLGVGADRQPFLLVGGTDGQFRTAPILCGGPELEFPKAFTAGDVDHDGDLDVWIGQYKFPYVQGAMPTPFYDANDGYPAALLINDGQGHFVDQTETAGLAAKRNRRTYSASFVDLDNDHSLDLLTVNDFSGLDVYRNDGQGHFEEVTSAWLSDRQLFGMAHAIADFNLDGMLDIYAIGMSSTTARRLDSLRLGRRDFKDVNEHRAAMGYGNRLLLGQGSGKLPRFVQPSWNDRIARTGWSWGTTATDFNNDGAPDIYVGNGHTSGRSARDYCTRYWCHDVYTGDSQTNLAVSKLFDVSLRDFRHGDISWNGFEHNVLWLNERNGNFFNAAFLLGVAFEFDSRAVVSDDLDGDGRRDLVVVRFHQEQAGAAEYTLHVLRNELSNAGHWIGFRMNDAVAHRSPMGAVVRVQLDDGSQLIQAVVSGDSFSAQHSATVHFGLGDHQPERVTIEWPDGTSQVIDTPARDRYHRIEPK